MYGKIHLTLYVFATASYNILLSHFYDLNSSSSDLKCHQAQSIDILPVPKLTRHNEPTEDSSMLIISSDDTVTYQAVVQHCERLA